MACTYPTCDCAVSFPVGHAPSETTECPRAAALVFVVMSNDYPAAVFTTEAAAEAFCAERRKLPTRTRVYWRVYPFPLDGIGGEPDEGTKP